MKKIGLGVAAVFLLVVVGGFVLNQLQGSASDQAKVGDCARITGVEDKPKYQVMSCQDDQANVRIAKVVELDAQCPTGGTEYSTFTGSNTFCLMPNFREGVCYGQNQESGIAKVDCATPNSVKVVKVVNQRDADCGEARPAIFPEPAVTFCLRPGNQR